ncbi:MAG: radical SAM protein, partial [Blastocatellia bacterium]|nr:radical SAM protein [Blastocatellia bacterium]
MSVVNSIDFDVLKRFNKPGPRYTSYPTAPLFSPTFTAEDYVREITDTNSRPLAGPLSLYVHFPFCEKLCYFCGCNMMVTHDRSMIAKYNQYLAKEIDMLVPLIATDRKVEQMHWGGGTPSYLTPEEILQVGEMIRERFEFDEGLEASVEIDPRGLTFDHMSAFREIGFNRTSFGVQDFNPLVQETINRV